MDRTGFAVTDVKVVEALIKLILKEDNFLSIKIVESDSESKFAEEAFKIFGYKALEERMNNSGSDVSLINLSHMPTTRIKFDGLYFKDPKLPKIITESKFFISIAVAKTHYLAFITGALKNLFGLLPRKEQSYYHPNISEVIIDLNQIVKPDLCIVDARMGLEGWAGPKKRRINTFILGRNPASVDATMARIMGFEPKKILQLVEAEKKGLGTLDPEVLGESLKATIVKFNPPYNL
jgi:uncharacterized protein (DUF362 family)